MGGETRSEAKRRGGAQPLLVNKRPYVLSETSGRGEREPLRAFLIATNSKGRSNRPQERRCPHQVVRDRLLLAARNGFDLRPVVVERAQRVTGRWRAITDFMQDLLRDEPVEVLVDVDGASAELLDFVEGSC